MLHSARWVLAAAGADPDDVLPHAVADASVVVSMLSAGDAVGVVIEAALDALRPGTLWIDMSSTRQDEAQAFHALLLGYLGDAARAAR